MRLDTVSAGSVSTPQATLPAARTPQVLARPAIQAIDESVVRGRVIREDVARLDTRGRGAVAAYAEIGNGAQREYIGLVMGIDEYA